MSEREYAYAVGRIRALETRLLNGVFYERLLGTPSMAEAMQIMAETDYGVAEGSRDYESSIEEEILGVYRLLERLAPESPELAVFRFRFDLHNLKLLTREDLTGRPSRLGSIPWEDLTEMVKRGDGSAWPVEIAEAMFQTPDQKRIIALDQAYYRYGWRILGARDGILQDYWRARLDLTNLKTFIRWRLAGGAPDELEHVLVIAGRIAAQEWRELMEAPWESLAAFLTLRGYGEVTRQGAGLDNLSLLEQAVDTFLLERMGEARRIALGIEPLIAYLIAKEMEALNLRLVFAGKTNQIPAESIRRRLRRGII